MNGNSKMFKQVVCGVLIILIAGWVTYVSVKGVSIDALVAGINTRVTVLETVASTIKDDVVEIKMLIKEVRDDQRGKGLKGVERNRR
jgi:hypothetical protein